MYFRAHVRKDKTIIITVNANELTEYEKSVLKQNSTMWNVNKDTDIATMIFENWDSFSFAIGVSQDT